MAALHEVVKQDRVKLQNCAKSALIKQNCDINARKKGEETAWCGRRCYRHIFSTFFPSMRAKTHLKQKKTRERERFPCRTAREKKIIIPPKKFPNLLTDKSNMKP